LPPLNALRAFEAAARLGRMTIAADELAVTPGAISRQVRQLELNIGTQLFEGPKNNPSLTAAGVALLRPLTTALDQIEAAIRTVSDNDSGTLDVSCFSTFTVKWLLPRLYQFNALYPDIEIRLSAADRTPDTHRERYDLTITVAEEANLGRLHAVPLFPEWLGPVLAPSLADSIRLRTSKDIIGKPLLHTRSRQNAWQMWCDAVRCKMPVADGPEFEHLYFTLEAAIGGLGICVAPWHLVAEDVRAGRLVAPLGFQESGYRYVALRRQQANKKLDRFCEWLQTQATEMPQPPSIARRGRSQPK
jgi:LysR family transcriptional regulator, glycine cleavage system transcriptional activator